MKGWMSRLHILLPLIPALVAAMPLFGFRFIPTHDGEYHIIRFWQFYEMLSSGVWFPRWAPDLNLGFGIPLFTFNYPFPNYVGSFFHLLGVSFVDSVKWTLASGYLLAVICCYLWLQRLFGKVPAAVGAIASSYVPYWFVDIYVRGSVGEVWALAFVFAALASVEAGRRFWAVISIALLIISHNILALLFVPILLLYSFMKHRKLVWDVLLGVGAASYFWIPALYEQQYIRGINPVHMFDYFPQLWQVLIPTWGTNFRGSTGGGTEMSYQIGIMPLFTLLGIIVTWKRRLGKQSKVVLFAIGLFLFAVAMMLPWSMSVWKLMPMAQFIQYPWRLLSLVIVAVPVLAAHITKEYRWGWVIAVIAILSSFGYTRPVTYDPRSDNHYLIKQSFISGTSSLGDALQTAWIKRGSKELPHEFSLPTGQVKATREKPTVYVLDVSAFRSGELVAPIAYYPGWQARLDGTTSRVFPNVDGLIATNVPQGRHTLRLWLGLTSAQKFAWFVTILSLFVASASFILKKQS